MNTLKAQQAVVQVHGKGGHMLFRVGVCGSSL